MENKTRTKRSIRFEPDQGAVAYISRNLNDSEITAGITALPINESYDGVSLIILKTNKVSVSEKLLIQVGKLAPIVGEVKWIKELDVDTIRLGVQYV